jgi:ornithine carbamoyltransferase
MRALTHPKDFISIADWRRDHIEQILARARALKMLRREGAQVQSLSGCSVLLYFEKPSLRTYVTFGVGVSELGGTPIYLPPGQVQLGGREAVEDVARNLSRMCHAIVARTYAHEIVVKLAEHATIPVVNALTDHLHPCQAIADVMTASEHGDPARERIVYIGDGNNVAHSLLHACAVLGLRLTVCTPPDFMPDASVVERALLLARHSGADLRLESDPHTAVKDAAFIYTDVWASMGQEDQATARAAIFRPYQVNEQLLASAPSGARILHCLPAHRDEEITAAVLESERSLVFDQAENRLHAQKAILEALLA